MESKVTVIEDSKDLNLVQLNELVGNLKVYEVIMETDEELGNDKKRLKGVALKASEDYDSQSDEEEIKIRNEDDEFVMAVRNFRKFFKRGGRFNKQPFDEKKKSFDGNKRFQ